MTRDHLGPRDRPDADADVRRMLRLAAPDVAAPQGVDEDLDRGRVALGRRRSLLATLGVGAGTALVAVAAVLVPQGLAGGPGAGAPASRTSLPAERGTSAPDPQEARVLPVGGTVPLVAGPQQHGEDVVATVVPLGWELTSSSPQSLTLTDAGSGEELVVAPAAQPYSPPVLSGVGDFEPLGGAWASYYLVDGTGGAARPMIVMQLTNGRWADVSASPALGWGMAELSAFARGLRAPFTCTDPCEVPLAP